MTSSTKKIPPIFFILAIGISMFGIWKILPLFIKDTEKSPTADRSLTPATLMSAVPNIPSGTFNYGGSTTWAPIRKEVDTVIRFGSNFKLVYVHPSTGNPSTNKGIEMLLDGKLDFVQSSKGIPTELQQYATQKGIKLKEIPIAIDAIAVVVHPSLKLPGLTLEQLQEIQAGKITNWRVIGGADLPIRIYALNSEDLNGTKFTPIKNATDAFQKISIDPGGIYWGASVTLAVPQCGVKTIPMGTDGGKFVSPYQVPVVPDCSAQQHNQVNPAVFQTGSYPLLRKLSVIVIEDGSLKQKAGEAYAQMLLTAQGQSLIRKAGYLNLSQ
jgi:phosphate transport system substrate-binding protein